MASLQQQQQPRPAVLSVRDCGMSGRGVFLECDSVPIGEVLTLYPGVHYPPPPLWATFGSQDTPTAVISSASLRMEDTTKNNDYLITLEATGGCLDGFEFRATRGIGEIPLELCCGHLVNHPNAGEEPNCDVVDFTWREVLGDWDDDGDQLLELSEHLNPLAPGLWVIDAVTTQHYHTDGSTSSTNASSSSAGALMPRPVLAGLAIVATKPINHHDQLLLDYKLQPPHPPWYTPAS